MKKTLLILSILLSAVLVWYFYTGNTPEPTEKIEEISELEKELNFYREYAALTGHNTKYAWRLFDAGKERLKNGDYYGAETFFNEFDSIKIRQWWLSEPTNPTLKENYYSYLQKSSLKYAGIYENTGRIEETLNIYLENNKPFKAAEIYENTGRLDKALDLYLDNKLNYFKNFDCGTGMDKIHSRLHNKIFQFSISLQKYDTAFTIYMNNLHPIYNITDTSGLTEVISYKISKYNYLQRDSILKAAYKSIVVLQKEDDRYPTRFKILDKEIYKFIRIDYVGNVKNKAQAKQYAWNDFKRTRLYELLAERPDKQ